MASLKKGPFGLGAPAFPTKEGAAHKAVHRKRRLVVDHRALNRVTVRRVFLIPDANQVKSRVAGCRFTNVGGPEGRFQSGP